jgi:bifunctional DNase/RNase
MKTRRVRLLELRVSAGGEPPLVVLKEADGERLLPIWTNYDGMTAIVGATEASKTETVTTHELIRDLMMLFSHQIESVVITGYEDGRYFAELTVDKRKLILRPSDGIAISVLSGCPLLCVDDVLDAAGVHPEPQAEVERFRQFLEEVDPGDFDLGEPSPES